MPPGDDVEDVIAIHDAAERSDRPVLVDDVHRFTRENREARERADAAKWLTGAKFEEVYAELGYQRGLMVDDGNVSSVRLSDGTAFTTDKSWTTLDRDEFWGGSEPDVAETDDTLTVNDYSEAFRLVRDGADRGVTKHHFGPSESEALILDFANAFDTGRDPVATVGSTASDGSGSLRPSTSQRRLAIRSASTDGRPSERRCRIPTTPHRVPEQAFDRPTPRTCYETLVLDAFGGTACSFESLADGLR